MIIQFEYTLEHNLTISIFPQEEAEEEEEKTKKQKLILNAECTQLHTGMHRTYLPGDWKQCWLVAWAMD